MSYSSDRWYIEEQRKRYMEAQRRRTQAQIYCNELIHDQNITDIEQWSHVDNDLMLEIMHIVRRRDYWSFLEDYRHLNMPEHAESNNLLRPNLERKRLINIINIQFQEYAQKYEDYFGATHGSVLANHT